MFEFDRGLAATLADLIADRPTIPEPSVLAAMSAADLGALDHNSEQQGIWGLDTVRASAEGALRDVIRVELPELFG